MLDFNIFGTSNGCVAPIDPLALLVMRALVRRAAFAQHEPAYLTRAGLAQTPVLYLSELGVLMLASIVQIRLLPAPTQGSDADGMPRAKPRWLQPFVPLELSQLRTRCESRAEPPAPLGRARACDEARAD